VLFQTGFHCLLIAEFNESYSCTTGERSWKSNLRDLINVIVSNTIQVIVEAETYPIFGVTKEVPDLSLRDLDSRGE